MATKSAGALPEPGCDASEFLVEQGLILRHGNSLSLMALVSEWLNETEEFNHIDPGKCCVLQLLNRQFAKELNKQLYEINLQI